MLDKQYFIHIYLIKNDIYQQVSINQRYSHQHHSPTT